MGEQFEAKRTAEIRERTLAAGQVNQTAVNIPLRAAVGRELGKDMSELTLLKNKANIR